MSPHLGFGSLLILYQDPLMPDTSRCSKQLNKLLGKGKIKNKTSNFWLLSARSWVGCDTGPWYSPLDMKNFTAYWHVTRLLHNGDRIRQKQDHSIVKTEHRWKQEHCSPQNWPNICLSQSRWVTAVSLPITARALCPCRVLGECLQGNLSIAVLLYDCTQQSKTVLPRTFPQITEQATSVQWAPPNILYWDTKVLCGMVANPTVSDFTYVPGGLLLEASASCLMANKTS